jgi:hypothetical protein
VIAGDFDPAAFDLERGAAVFYGELAGAAAQWLCLLQGPNPMADRQQLHEAVERLPASELDAALRYLKFLWYDSQEKEPVDEQTAAKLNAARAEGGEPSRSRKSNAATACNANGSSSFQRRSVISTDLTASPNSASSPRWNDMPQPGMGK